MSAYQDLVELSQARGWVVGLALAGTAEAASETLSVYDGRPIRKASVLARVNVNGNLNDAAEDVLRKIR